MGGELYRHKQNCKTKYKTVLCQPAVYSRKNINNYPGCKGRKVGIDGLRSWVLGEESVGREEDSVCVGETMRTTEISTSKAAEIP